MTISKMMTKRYGQIRDRRTWRALLGLNVKAVLLFYIPLLIGCAAAKVTGPATKHYEGPEIRTIAVVGDGSLASAISVELLNRGYRVMEPAIAQTADAVLYVEPTDDHDASVRLVSAESGEIIAIASFRNARLAAPGSPADLLAKRGPATVARRIVDSLVQQLQ